MIYKFIGAGMGVPGLPHQISEEEAERLGVKELLQAAIDNGNYVPVDQPIRDMKTTKKEVKHGQ